MRIDRKKVKLAMERAHMTVHDVAKDAGMPPQTAAAIICGMNVQPDTLGRIAQALGVGIADIAQGVVYAPTSHRRAGEDCCQAGEPPKLPAGQVKIDTARFAEAQARAGLSVRQLAHRAGVSPDTVRSIGRGAEAHKESTVDKLAEALGVAVCNIIKRESST